MIHKLFLIILLLVIEGAFCQNYTILQKQKLSSLGPEIESFYSKLYGDKDSLVLSKSIKLKKWNYPTSSVHELKTLYSEEIELVNKLRKLLSLLVTRKLVQTESRLLHFELKEFELPTEANFYEAAGLGIIQIHGQHELDINEIVSGKIAGYQSPHSLSASDCHQLSLASRNLGRLDLQIDWMKTAIGLEKNKHRRSVFKTKLSDLKHFHDKLILEQGFLVDQDKYEELSSIEVGTTIITKNQPELKKNAKDPRVAEHREKLNQIKLKFNYNDPDEYFFNITNQDGTTYNMFRRKTKDMKQLCSGENLRPPSLDINIKCKHMNKRDPYLMLGPFKMEDLHIAPYVGLVHEFIFQDEAEWVIKHTGDHLMPTPYNSKGKYLKFSKKRTSQIKYLQDLAGQPTAALTWRMTLATNFKLLEPFAQENYQVMNYGPGGIISFHMDETPAKQIYEEDVGVHFDEIDQMIWNLGAMRIATTMIYLKSAKSGGRTVFPMLSLTVPPTPRGLLFWHNITPSHVPDTRALHAACPVIHGDKWIMNKWVTLAPHWNTHPCHMTRDKQVGN